MPIHAQTTTVRNTSGTSMFFAFLGEHGATLADDADLDVPGNLFTRWQNDAVMRSALDYALQHGLITVLRTPTVVNYDYGAGAVKALKFNSGATLIDPEYGSYSGSAPTT